MNIRYFVFRFEIGKNTTEMEQIERHNTTLSNLKVDFWKVNS